MHRTVLVIKAYIIGGMKRARTILMEDLTLNVVIIKWQSLWAKRPA